MAKVFTTVSSANDYILSLRGAYNVSYIVWLLTHLVGLNSKSDHTSQWNRSQPVRHCWGYDWVGIATGISTDNRCSLKIPVGVHTEYTPWIERWSLIGILTQMNMLIVYHKNCQSFYANNDHYCWWCTSIAAMNSWMKNTAVVITAAQETMKVMGDGCTITVCLYLQHGMYHNEDKC